MVPTLEVRYDYFLHCTTLVPAPLWLGPEYMRNLKTISTYQETANKGPKLPNIALKIISI